MVGQPKNLHDLAKIEADVRITCRRCRFEEDWTREDLARHLHAIGGSTVWSEITRHLTCRRHGCGSRDVRALPVPYARRQANVPRRVGKLDARLIAAAMGVLEQAASRGGEARTVEVHLALLVAYRYARDAASVRAFWELAGRSGRSVAESLAGPLEVIRHRLVGRGWLPPAVLIERTPTWPWNSPAPPGWLSPPGLPRAEEESAEN